MRSYFTKNQVTRTAVLVAIGSATLAGTAGCLSLAGDGNYGTASAVDPGPSPQDDDGDLPPNTRATDTDLAGIANVEAPLLRAIQEASQQAKQEGIEIYINSGWRAESFQQRLFDAAIEEHGSKAEALKWVSPANKSMHVAGKAVDIGDLNASAWLGSQGRGEALGLCQTYANEDWHFEYFPDAATQGCPKPYPNAAQDPRMN